MVMKHNLKLFSLIGCSLLLFGCATSDYELARHQQCNNLRHEILRVQNNPHLLKTQGTSRQYKDMRLEYGSLDCKDLSDYFSKNK